MAKENYEDESSIFVSPQGFYKDLQKSEE